jgi:hypothetical protein
VRRLNARIRTSPILAGVLAPQITIGDTATETSKLRRS